MNFTTKRFGFAWPLLGLLLGMSSVGAAPVMQSVSINFSGARTSNNSHSPVSGSTLYGAEPIAGSSWNNVPMLTNTDLALIDGSGAALSGVTLTTTGPNNYTLGTGTVANGNIFYSYIDDGGNGASITVKGLTAALGFSTYSVFIYQASDNAGKVLADPLVTADGVSSYYSVADGVTVSRATQGSYGGTSITLDQIASGFVSPVYGGNYVRIDNLSGETLNVVGKSGADGRGGIAAIQIVAYGNESSFIGTASGVTTWDGVVWDNGPWVNGAYNSAEISVPGETELSIDNPLEAYRVIFSGAGPLTLSKAEGATTEVDTYDFSAVAGSSALSFSPNAACVIAGTDTRLASTGTGQLLVTADKSATLAPGVRMGSYVNSGLITVEGTISSASAPITAGRVRYQDLTITAQQPAMPATLVVRQGDTINFNGGNMQRVPGSMDMAGGEITVPGSFWLGSNNNTLNQTGGRFISTSAADDAFLIGWSSGMTWNLSNCEVSAPNGCVKFWDGTVTMNIGTGAIVDLRGVTTGGGGTRTLNLKGGTLKIGATGIASAMAGVNFTGGTLEAKATATIGKAVVLGADSTTTLSVAEGETLTLAGLSGAGNLVTEGGAVVLSAAAPSFTGSLTCGGNVTVPVAGLSGVERVTFGEGAVLNLIVTDSMDAYPVFSQAVEMTGTPASVMLDGLVVEGTWANGIFTPSGRAPTLLYWKGEPTGGIWNSQNVSWSANPDAEAADEAFLEGDSVVLTNLSGTLTVAEPISSRSITFAAAEEASIELTVAPDAALTFLSGTGINQAGPGSAKLSFASAVDVPLSVAADTQLILNPPAGGALNTDQLSGSGAIIKQGEGTSLINVGGASSVAASGFTVNEGLLTFRNTTGVQAGILSPATTFNVAPGATLVMKTRDVAGWVYNARDLLSIAGHVEFQAPGVGGSEAWSSGIRFRDGGTLANKRGIGGDGFFFSANPNGGLSGVQVTVDDGARAEILGGEGTYAIGLEGAPRTHTFTVGEKAVLTVSAAIIPHAGSGGSAGIAKSGNGALILAGQNTYSGATSVLAGTLTVTGSTGGSSAISVASGAIISGTGTINGSLTLADGSTVSLASTSGLNLIGELAAEGTVSIDVSAIDLNQVPSGRVGIVLPFNGGSPTASFELIGDPTRMLFLQVESDGVVLGRRSGTLISIY